MIKVLVSVTTPGKTPYTTHALLLDFRYLTISGCTCSTMHMNSRQNCDTCASMYTVSITVNASEVLKICTQHEKHTMKLGRHLNSCRNHSPLLYYALAAFKMPVGCCIEWHGRLYAHRRPGLWFTSGPVHEQKRRRFQSSAWL